MSIKVVFRKNAVFFADVTESGWTGSTFSNNTSKYDASYCRLSAAVDLYRLVSWDGTENWFPVRHQVGIVSLLALASLAHWLQLHFADFSLFAGRKKSRSLKYGSVNMDQTFVFIAQVHTQRTHNEHTKKHNFSALHKARMQSDAEAECMQTSSSETGEQSAAASPSTCSYCSSRITVASL